VFPVLSCSPAALLLAEPFHLSGFLNTQKETFEVQKLLIQFPAVLKLIVG
jgi:hypothetical protein